MSFILYWKKKSIAYIGQQEQDSYSWFAAIPAVKLHMYAFFLVIYTFAKCNYVILGDVSGKTPLK